MDLKTLLSKIDNSKIGIQNILNSAVNFQWKKKNGAMEITFLTDSVTQEDLMKITSGQNLDNILLMVRIPRKDYEEAIKSGS